jgi:outer membrane receptor protein involved in Fe transport
MRNLVSSLLAFGLFFSVCLSAADFHGTVVDPSGSPVPGAQVAIVTRVGVQAQTVSAADGAFKLSATLSADAKLVVTAPGFSTVEAPLATDPQSPAPSPQPLVVRLAIAPQTDSVRVVGSALDVAASQQGGSVEIIPPSEIRGRNEPMALDLLRYIPGLAVSQTGPTGGIAGLYIRGGYPDFNLVEIDGVPVNAFGGDFDFAQVPTAELDHIEVIRGPQSAIYGPYANSGVVNFVTREPQAAPSLDALAEGGTYQERRFAISGGGTLAGFGIAASASRIDTNGPVTNSDYRNEGLMLNVTRRFGRQSLALHGDFDSNENGVPGPWGSDPMHTFTGIDTVSRNKNNFSDYMARYDIDLSPRVREEAYATFFLNNNGFTSALYGFSFNKDLRGQAEARTIVSVTPHYAAAFGVSEMLEEVKNSYITDAQFDTFPVRRNDTAVYFENRFEFGGRLFVNAGVRGEFIRTAAIPSGYGRPLFPAQTISVANPKLAAAYVLGRTRLHSSFGTGIRPPGGFDLAFTDNPALKPERTRSFDAGVEQRLLGDRLALDATYFYNRFHDLIVILGGSLTRLSHYQSDNLANSRAEGAEFSARLRPSRPVFIRASYTRLKTEILSLDHAAGAAPQPFAVGQQLIRRPADSGTLVAGYTRGRLAADLTGYFRGQVLDVEPALGATNGLFWNPGYTVMGVNLNYELAHGVSAYGNLRNALNRHYEEVLGYPSPRLNFVAGLKWSIPGR